MFLLIAQILCWVLQRYKPETFVTFAFARVFIQNSRVQNNNTVTLLCVFVSGAEHRCVRRRELTGAVYLGQVSQPPSNPHPSLFVCWVGEIASFLSGLPCHFHSCLHTVGYSHATGFLLHPCCQAGILKGTVLKPNGCVWLWRKFLSRAGGGTCLKWMHSTRNALHACVFTLKKDKSCVWPIKCASTETWF